MTDGVSPEGFKVGMRVGAIQSADAKEVKLFGYGVYEGEFPCDMLGGDTNPRIKLDDGGTVWGCECWWGPEEETRANIGGRTVTMVEAPGTLPSEELIAE